MIDFTQLYTPYPRYCIWDFVTVQLLRSTPKKTPHIPSAVFFAFLLEIEMNERPPCSTYCWDSALQKSGRQQKSRLSVDTAQLNLFQFHSVVAHVGHTSQSCQPCLINSNNTQLQSTPQQSGSLAIRCKITRNKTALYTTRTCYPHFAIRVPVWNIPSAVFFLPSCWK